MARVGTAVRVFVLVVTVAAGSVLAVDWHEGDKLGIESASAQQLVSDLGSPFARGQYTTLNPADVDAPFPPFPPYPLPPYPPGYTGPQFPPGYTSYNHPGFNMTHGNAVFGVIIPNLGTWIYEEVSHNFADPSLAFRYVTLILNVGYDATAPYSQSAKGVYSHIDNRPASEYADSKNMNVASIHAVYRLAMAFDASNKAQWDRMLTDNGLDPNDYNAGIGLSCDRPNLSTVSSDKVAVAIGNIAAQCVIDGRVNDGFNQPLDGTTNLMFVDTTGYKPVNSPDNLVDLSRWQPLTSTTSDGLVLTQQFITPQWANTVPYSIDDPRQYRANPPVKSDYYSNGGDYRAQAWEVAREAANLDDRKKMLAEYFDNKARETLFFPAVEAVPKSDMRDLVVTNSCPPPHTECMNTRDFWQLDFMLHIAQFDAGIVVWQEKARYDAVRPTIAIRNALADETVTTFDGRTVQGSEWSPYLKKGDHPEYPSATTCFCAAQAEAWKRYHGGSDTIPDVNGNGLPDDLAGVLRKGTSIHEPGITPRVDLSISFATWSEYKKTCADSRVWGGVHFRDAVDASMDLCGDIGRVAYEYFDTLLDGTAELKQPALMGLAPDPRLNEPHFTVAGKTLVCR